MKRQTFGQALLSLREQYGLTQRECCAQSGIDSARWSKLENGQEQYRYRPTIDTVKRCAAAISNDKAVLLRLLVAAGHRCAHEKKHVLATPHFDWCRNCGAIKTGNNEFRVPKTQEV